MPLKSSFLSSFWDALRLILLVLYLVMLATYLAQQYDDARLSAKQYATAARQTVLSIRAGRQKPMADEVLRRAVQERPEAGAAGPAEQAYVAKVRTEGKGGGLKGLGGHAGTVKWWCLRMPLGMLDSKQERGRRGGCGGEHRGMQAGRVLQRKQQLCLHPLFPAGHPNQPTFPLQQLFTPLPPAPRLPPPPFRWCVWVCGGTPPASGTWLTSWAPSSPLCGLLLGCT